MTMARGGSALALKKKGLRQELDWHTVRSHSFSTGPEEKGIETSDRDDQSHPRRSALALKKKGLRHARRSVQQCPTDVAVQHWP